MAAAPTLAFTKSEQMNKALDSAFLEKKFQCKLNLPWRVNGIRDLARQRVRNAGTGCGKSEQAGIGQTEIRMIEDIERFHAKLSRQSLRHSSILHHREVEIPKAWTFQRVSSQVAEFPDGRRGETCGVEPLVHVAHYRVGTATRYQIGAPNGKTHDSRLIVACHYGEGIAGYGGDNAADLPAIGKAISMER